MNPHTVFAIVSVVILVGSLWLAIQGFRSTGKTAEKTARANHKAPQHRPTQQHPRTSRLTRSDRRAGLLPLDATVTFAAERRAAGIDEIFAGLDKDLVGLVPVKKKVQEIAALLLVDRARKRFGLEAPRPNLHMCFTGPPGTGKTTVALRMAELLHRLGYIEQGQLVHAMRDDLVGEYIGHTAPKTKRVLDRAMGGVLFIDEAYYLYRASEQSSYYLSDEAEAAFRHYVTNQMAQPGFANARSVRNELEHARLRHAHRLAADLDRSWNRDDLMRIEPVDIFAGHSGLLPALHQA